MVTMEYVDLVLKRPASIPFKIVEKVLVVMVEVDISIIPDNLPPITQVGVVYWWVYPLLLFLFTTFLMVITDVIIVVMM